MTMNHSLAHLPAQKQRQLEEVTAIIVKAIDPEKVILFGSHATGKWVEDWYVEDHISHDYISDYDILVITKQGDLRKDYEVQDVIKNRTARYRNPVMPIVHDIDYVNKMLGEGHYFFSDIEKEGIMLYDAGRVELADRRPLTPAEKKMLAQEHYDHWFESGKDFLNGSRLYLGVIKNYKLGAFILHQATERTYNAVELVFTGYKPNTHSLAKLRKYTWNFSKELASVFPDDTPEEVHLFDLLKRGYVDARYKKDYKISAAELQILIDRVGKLQEIAERICKEKIESFLI
jgi:predicted nucleotidyltransferase/HEPN domain-containing protein